MHYRSRQKVVNTPGTTTIASDTLARLLDSGRVRENNEPFNLHDALSRAAANAGCRLILTEFSAGLTDDNTLLGENVGLRPEDQTPGPASLYKLHLEFQMEPYTKRGSGSARSSSRLEWLEGLDRDNCFVSSWESTSPVRLTDYVNRELQEFVEPYLRKCMSSTSTSLADRIGTWFDTQRSKLLSKRTKATDTVTVTVTGYPSQPKAQAFLVEMVRSKGAIILEIRDSTGVPKMPLSTAALPSEPDDGQTSDGDH